MLREVTKGFLIIATEYSATVDILCVFDGESEALSQGAEERVDGGHVDVDLLGLELALFPKAESSTARGWVWECASYIPVLAANHSLCLDY
jgi:hypothetical protein